MPDIIIPENQYEIICEKYTKAKRTFELYKSPSNKLRNQLKNAKRKYEVATKIMATTPKTSRNLVKRDMSLLSTLKKREFSKKQFKKHLDNSTNEISNLKIELAEANATITQLKDELQSTSDIGRIRCWGIMKCVWPINRMDILSSTWQMIGHIVNLTMPPIGPKE